LITEEVALELQTRKKIYNYILKHPGLHKRKLSSKLKIPFSTLNYHLRYLEKCALIVINSEERYDRVYAAKNIGTMDKKLLNAMRQETPRNIILNIGLSYVSSQAEISRDLELSPTVISRHLKRLIDQGIVEIAPVENGATCTAHKQKMIIERSTKGREILYRLTRPASADMHTDVLVTRLLLRYKTGLPDDTIKSVLEFINNVDPKAKMPKKIKHNGDIDRFLKIFYETFPHPYHV
jgi:DNA-binding transcriptional ArsR family regulator